MTSQLRSSGSGVFATVLVCLVAGAIIEVLRNWADWQLGFSAPAWEVIVGWIGLSALSAMAASGLILGGLGFYSVHVHTNRVHSYDAKERLIEVKQRAALSLIGAGMLAAFGGLVLWLSGNLGPEFRPYAGLARLATFFGLALAVGAYLYAKKEPKR